MSGRRKNVMDIRDLLPHMRNTASDRGVQRATGVDRRTVKQSRNWAQEHGLLTGPLPSAEELQALVKKMLGGPPPRWAAILSKQGFKG
jgi:hypothetical protein